MEKNVYVIYLYETEREVIVKMTEKQAEAIQWFIKEFEIDSSIDTLNNYDVREI